MTALRLATFFILASLIGTALPPFRILQAAETQKASKVSQKSIIVKYKKDARPIERKLAPGETVEDLLKRLAKDPAVEYAEPNHVYKASLIPNDTHYANQWYMKRVKAPEAWDVHATSPGVIIAVIDSGVQITHPDLKANIWVNAQEIDKNGKDDDRNGLVDDRYGWDFVNNVPDPSPKFKSGFTEAGILHGTIVAGIAAAAGDNGEGISGVSWNAKIMALKALGDDGDGDTVSVIKAIDYAVAKGANIINLSFVGFAYSRSLKDAIQRAYDAGVQVVAPAGNEQSGDHGVNLDEHPIYPACYKNEAGRPIVIGVAATDGIDQKALFSGYGASCIALSAPGLSFYSTIVYEPNKSVDGRYFNQLYDGYWSGTSVAVPLVSGALALIQGANPSLSPGQVTDILVSQTDDINALNPDYQGQLGRGRLNIALAVTEAAARAQRPQPFFAMTPAAGSVPVISITDPSGKTLGQFMAYKKEFRGGVNLSAGDVDGDSNDEIIAAPASGLEADIRIFNAKGSMLSHFLAYPATFRGGVNIATIDYDNDGRKEIVTVPASGYQSEVKIFTANGKLLKSFLAYPAAFKGGASVATGDVLGSSVPEIVTGAGKGGIPQVKVFSKTGALASTFVAGARTAATGLRVSLLDVDANIRRRQSEIVVSRQTGPANAALYDFRGSLRKSWQLFDSNFRGDAKTVAADLNGDALKEIIAFPGAGAAAHIRIFDRGGNFANSFYASDPGSDDGLNLTVFYINR